MAVFIRCSSFFPRPCSFRSPPSDNISGKPYVPGTSPSLLFKVGKVVSSFQDALSGQIGIHHFLPSSKVIHLGLKEHQRSEGSWDLSQMLPVNDKYLERLLALEGSQRFRFPTMAFLFTNAFMLTTPLEALAETYEAENFFFNMPLLLLVALVGATVGGLLARQRKGEMERLNEQLRQINAALRRQAKIKSYAPSLSYAPVGGRIPDDEVIVYSRKQELISRLKTGKNFLRNQEPAKAFVEFKTALELA